MGKVVVAGLPTSADLVRLNTMIDALKFKGPGVALDILAGEPGQVQVRAWTNERPKTEPPSFSSTGNVEQVFAALRAWFLQEGWITS